MRPTFSLIKVLKVLSKEAANMALLAKSPGAIYCGYVSPCMPPARMNGPNPKPNAVRYNKGSKKFGNRMVFQCLRKMVALRCQTRNAPRGEGILTASINPPTSGPSALGKHLRGSLAG